MIGPNFIDTGPPSSRKRPRPRRNSSEAKLSGWTADKIHVVRRRQFCKPYRRDLFVALVTELKSRIASIEFTQPLLTQRQPLVVPFMPWQSQSTELPLGDARGGGIDDRNRVGL